MIVVGCETICFRWWAMLRSSSRHPPLVEMARRVSDSRYVPMVAYHRINSTRSSRVLHQRRAEIPRNFVLSALLQC
jgi:hypothetical protein